MSNHNNNFFSESECKVTSGSFRLYYPDLDILPTTTLDWRSTSYKNWKRSGKAFLDYVLNSSLDLKKDLKLVKNTEKDQDRLFRCCVQWICQKKWKRLETGFHSAKYKVFGFCPKKKFYSVESNSIYLLFVDFPQSPKFW